MTTSCRRSAIALVSAVTLTGPLLLAQPTLPPPPAGVRSFQKFGQEFVVIGNAGNRAPNSMEASFPENRRGAVGYEYGLARTELTVAQYAEFLAAYRPFYAGQYDGNILGFWVDATPPTSSGGAWDIRPVPGTERFPADMTWRMAATYCNWLHNDKAPTAAAFASGAYDISTFTYNPNGTSNDQLARSPGARYWIPTVDEWVKAGYYDPNRYGPGQEGYWAFPNQTNSLLRPGLPGTGAETANGVQDASLAPSQIDVATYPAAGVYGVFDISGGLGELSETALPYFDPSPSNRAVLGSQTNGSLLDDLLDRNTFLAQVTTPGLGLRLATIPAPHIAPLAFLSFGILTLNGRRRR